MIGWFQQRRIDTLLTPLRHCPHSCGHTQKRFAGLAHTVWGRNGVTALWKCHIPSEGSADFQARASAYSLRTGEEE